MKNKLFKSLLTTALAFAIVLTSFGQAEAVFATEADPEELYALSEEELMELSAYAETADLYEEDSIVSEEAPASEAEDENQEALAAATEQAIREKLVAKGINADTIQVTEVNYGSNADGSIASFPYVRVVYRDSYNSYKDAQFTQYYSFLSENGQLNYQKVLYTCTYGDQVFYYVLGGNKVYYNKNEKEHDVKAATVNADGTLTLTVKMFFSRKTLTFSPYKGKVYAFSNINQKEVDRRGEPFENLGGSYFPTNKGEVYIFTENRESNAIYQVNGKSGKIAFYYMKFFIDCPRTTGGVFSPQYVWYKPGRLYIHTFTRLGDR